MAPYDFRKLFINGNTITAFLKRHPKCPDKLVFDYWRHRKHSNYTPNGQRRNETNDPIYILDNTYYGIVSTIDLELVINQYKLMEDEIKDFYKYTSDVPEWWESIPRDGKPFSKRKTDSFPRVYIDRETQVLLMQRLSDNLKDFYRLPVSTRPGKGWTYKSARDWDIAQHGNPTVF